MRPSVSNGGASPLVFPLAGALQELQPLLVTGEALYVAGPAARDGPLLVTARGVSHRLRRLCDLRVLLAHAERANADRICARMNAEVAERRAGPAADPLAFFTEIMVPGLVDRDCGGETRYQNAFTETRARSEEAIDTAQNLAGAIRGELVPELPAPTLCVLGRAWRLTRAITPPGSVYVRYHDGLLVMTGEFVVFKTLLQEWETAVAGYCKAAASNAPTVGTSERLRGARETLARSGAVVNGDFLYLPSNPVRVGSFIPPHYNSAFGRNTGRDLALTAPLGFPPTIPGNSDLVVYQRGPTGRWEALQRPICLGSSPSAISAGGAVEAGVNLLAFLRFGAVRIAANGRFHEHDGREE